MKDSPKRDALYSIVALTVIVGAFFVLVYLPVQKSCRRLRAETAAAQGTISLIPGRVAELEILNRDIEQRRKFIESRRHRLPPKPELHAVVRDVSDLAREYGLQVTRLEPLEVDRRASYDVQPFRVGVRGPFAGMGAFLARLERHSRLLTLDELSLSQEPRQEGQSIVGDIRFSVYTKCVDFIDFAEIDDSSPPPRDDA